MKSTFYFLCIASLLLFLSGCGQVKKEPSILCQGKGNVDETILAITGNIGQNLQLKAKGRCVLTYHDDKGKRQKESFGVKLWFDLPDKFYLQGDIALDPKGIRAGVNRKIFFCAIKPQSSYFWGPLSGSDFIKPIDPRLILAFANPVIDEADYFDIVLDEQQVFDCLICTTVDKLAQKRFYIDRCSDLVRKIEYFEFQYSPNPSARISMDKYKNIADNISFPHLINIEIFDRTSDIVEGLKISFNSVSHINISEKQASRLFPKPSTAGFKNVYLIENDEIKKLD